MLKMLEKSETYQEILSKGEARGEAKGEARGEARGRREGYVASILSVLHTRFGDFDDQDIVQQLQITEDARLSQLVAEAISVEDLGAFRKLLTASP